MGNSLLNILVVDDEEAIRYTLNIFLNEAGYNVALAGDYESAVLLMQQRAFDLMFVDIIMEGKSGIDLLRTIKSRSPNAQVIIITGAPSVDSATDALRLGAFDYIIKPIRQNELLRLARIAFQHKSIADEKDRYRNNLETVFRSVTEGIVTFDTAGLITSTNESASKICGDAHDNAHGLQYTEMTQHCSMACHDVLKDVYANNHSRKLQHIECMRRNAPRQLVSVSASPLLDHMHRSQGVVMVLRDETRLQDLEGTIKESTSFNRMIGTSTRMSQLKQLIQTLAKVTSTVLVTGESGTGKELAAEALHNAGARHCGPLVKVNCGALTNSILESELFGHVQGAFTGAVKDRLGRFHLAHRGTIFLDEIGDISPKMQLQLLRILETMSFERVGSSITEQVDVRVVAATNRDLAARVAMGDFREDLFYRLKVVELNIPPLRERREDIPLLAMHNLKKFNVKFKKNLRGFSSDVERIFATYSWPGNIRELENAIEHSFILCDQDIITRAHLPAALRNIPATASPLPTIEEGQEVAAIENALVSTNGNKTEAARLLSMSRRTIYRKISKYNITS